MSGVIVHSAIRLNLNLRFLSVGLSNVWIGRDDRLCVSFVLMWKQALQNGRYYHSRCIDDTLRFTARSPVRGTLCIIPIVYVLFLSGTLCSTFNEPRTASFLRFFHFSLNTRQRLSGIFPSTESCFGSRDPALLQKLEIYAKVVCFSLLTVLRINWFAFSWMT
jgi:hypothetical protein